MAGEGTVLLRRSALGDVVLLGAITAAVPRPVTVVTDPRYSELAARLRGVDRVLPWGSPLPAGRVIDLQGSWETRRMRCDARLRKRSLARRRWLWWGGPAPRPPVPMIYGEAAGVVARPPPWIDMPRRPRDTLALLPGAAWVPKRPPEALLVACGVAWEGPVVVLGGPDEGDLVARVAAQVPGAEAFTEQGFQGTLERLAGVRVAVGGDSGLTHVAGACGASVVAFFGPTHPDDGFFVYPGEVVQRALSCRPCSLHRVRSCRQGDRLCMDLSTEAAVRAVQRCAGSS